jgi:hypothetical protein
MNHDWNKILNWKLLKGSHQFPGPDGGTCINEAAVVAAGLEYRAILLESDCPPCFSRPLSSFLLGLNDIMPDDLRQELLISFVTRLAGTADSIEIEQKRAELMALRFIKEILPIGLVHTGEVSCARALAEAGTLAEAQLLLMTWSNRVACTISTPRETHGGRMALTLLNSAENSVGSVVESSHDNIFAPMDFGLQRWHKQCLLNLWGAFQRFAQCGKLIFDYTVTDRDLFPKIIAILEDAMNLGKQAEPLEIETVLDRLERSKQSNIKQIELAKN